MKPEHPEDFLCPAGKVLEAKLIACTNNLITASQTLQNTCGDISKSIKDLTEYAVRDKERIEALEKSRDCKSQKINDLQDEVQDHAVKFAAHLGEHKAKNRLTVASSAGSAGGILGLWELIKYLVARGS